jgi:flagellar biosynthesis component FlhA
MRRFFQLLLGFLFGLALGALPFGLIWAVQEAADSVVEVRQALGHWTDFVRLYVIPGLGTLFLGACAALLAGLRWWAKDFFEKKKKADAIKAIQEAAAVEAKIQQDKIFQSILEETSARLLVAAAHARNAAERAESLGKELHDGNDKLVQEIAEVKAIAEKTEGLVNSKAELAARQIEALSKQLMDMGQRPEKGNGPEGEPK